MSDQIQEQMPENAEQCVGDQCPMPPQQQQMPPQMPPQQKHADPSYQCVGEQCPMPAEPQCYGGACPLPNGDMCLGGVCGTSSNADNIRKWIKIAFLVIGVPLIAFLVYKYFINSKELLV